MKLLLSDYAIAKGVNVYDIVKEGIMDKNVPKF
jgi:predicted ATP-grasp superfamily ATP-dependent carboligase